jgi:hypothetical protein
MLHGLVYESYHLYMQHFPLTWCSNKKAWDRAGWYSNNTTLVSGRYSVWILGHNTGYLDWGFQNVMIGPKLLLNPFHFIIPQLSYYFTLYGLIYCHLNKKAWNAIIMFEECKQLWRDKWRKKLKRYYSLCNRSHI